MHWKLRVYVVTITGYLKIFEQNYLLHCVSRTQKPPFRCITWYINLNTYFLHFYHFALGKKVGVVTITHHLNIFGQNYVLHRVSRPRKPLFWCIICYGNSKIKYFHRRGQSKKMGVAKNGCRHQNKNCRHSWYDSK